MVYITANNIGTEFSTFMSLTERNAEGDLPYVNLNHLALKVKKAGI